MSVNPKIVCRDVCKTFVQKGTRQVHVLEKVSLAVNENEFLVIAGPGQSGKSTLLRIIAGLEQPTSGEVTLNGEPVTGPGPDRAMVFQTYSLFPWRTVRQNVEMGLRFAKRPAAERHELADYYIHLVGLEGFENAYPHQLSGGMKQRVGIARAYVLNPEVFLLDEPFGQLDAQTRLRMENELASIWEKERRTIIFVTNNIDEAITMGDRVITLRGKLPGHNDQEYTVSLPRPREQGTREALLLRREITDASELIL